jgi:hypothetical protein
MKNNKEEINLRFNGEHTFFYSLIPIIIILYSLVWLAFFLKFGWIVKCVLLIILFFNVRFILKRNVTKVEFSDTGVTVFYLFGYKKLHNYDEIRVFRENKEGFYPITSINGHLKKKGKFYFYCPKNKKDKLNDFLGNKGLKVRPQL